MSRKELVEKAKALGIKYIAKKNMQVLEAEIKAISTKKVSKKVTYDDGRPYKVYSRERKTDDGLTYDKRNLHYNGKPFLPILPKDVLIKSKMDKMIAFVQTYCIWYDENADVFIIVLDATGKNDQGYWLAFRARLSKDNTIKSAVLIKKSASEEHLGRFLDDITQGKRMLDIETDM